MNLPIKFKRQGREEIYFKKSSSSRRQPFSLLLLHSFFLICPSLFFVLYLFSSSSYPFVFSQFSNLWQSVCIHPLDATSDYAGLWISECSGICGFQGGVDFFFNFLTSAPLTNKSHNPVSHHRMTFQNHLCLEAKIMVCVSRVSHQTSLAFSLKINS